MGPMALHPLQDAASHNPQGFHIVRQEHQPKREHPQAEKWKNAEQPTYDEQ
jgi:hypothetical protein